MIEASSLAAAGINCRTKDSYVKKYGIMGSLHYKIYFMKMNVLAKHMLSQNHHFSLEVIFTRCLLCSF